jgi:hypothetical protein
MTTATIGYRQQDRFDEPPQRLYAAPACNYFRLGKTLIRGFSADISFHNRIATLREALYRSSTRVRVFR